jgi:hypothetical protein
MNVLIEFFESEPDNLYEQNFVSGNENVIYAPSDDINKKFAQV